MKVKGAVKENEGKKLTGPVIEAAFSIDKLTFAYKANGKIKLGGGIRDAQKAKDKITELYQTEEWKSLSDAEKNHYQSMERLIDEYIAYRNKRNEQARENRRKNKEQKEREGGKAEGQENGENKKAPKKEKKDEPDAEKKDGKDGPAPKEKPEKSDKKAGPKKSNIATEKKKFDKEMQIFYSRMKALQDEIKKDNVEIIPDLEVVKAEYAEVLDQIRRTEYRIEKLQDEIAKVEKGRMDPREAAQLKKELEKSIQVEKEGIPEGEDFNGARATTEHRPGLEELEEKKESLEEKIQKNDGKIEFYTEKREKLKAELATVAEERKALSEKTEALRYEFRKGTKTREEHGEEFEFLQTKYAALSDKARTLKGAIMMCNEKLEKLTQKGKAAEQPEAPARPEQEKGEPESENKQNPAPAPEKPQTPVEKGEAAQKQPQPQKREEVQPAGKEVKEMPRYDYAPKVGQGEPYTLGALIEGQGMNKNPYSQDYDQPVTENNTRVRKPNPELPLINGRRVYENLGWLEKYWAKESAYKIDKNIDEFENLSLFRKLMLLLPNNKYRMKAETYISKGKIDTETLRFSTEQRSEVREGYEFKQDYRDAKSFDQSLRVNIPLHFGITNDKPKQPGTQVKTENSSQKGNEGR